MKNGLSIWIYAYHVKIGILSKPLMKEILISEVFLVFTLHIAPTRIANSIPIHGIARTM